MSYRPPRSGDLICARIGDRDVREHHGVIDAVADNGRTMILTASFGGLHRFDVVIRRVGPPAVKEIPMSIFSALREDLAKLLGHADPEVKAVAEAATEKVDALEADAGKVAGEVKADAETVAKDAEAVAPAVEHAVEAAAAPVVEAAIHDGEQVAAEAAADVATTL